MFNHVINDNTFNNNVVGSALFSGRWFLHIGNNRQELNAEWRFFHKVRWSCAAYLEFGSGDSHRGLMFHLAVPWLFSIYFSIHSIFPWKWFSYNGIFKEPRQTGIAIHNGGLWLYPFAKTMSWSSRDSWLSKSHSFNFVEGIFGRWKYSEENDGGWRDISIAMPENKYKGQLRMYTGVWRNRLWSKRIGRGEIKLDEGIPYPGKGENSWDCDEDACHGITCPADDEEDAICELIKHVMNCRRRYGCRKYMFDYTPEKRHIPVSSEIGGCVEEDSACSTILPTA